MKEILNTLKNKNTDEKFKGCFDGSISKKIAWIDVNMKAYFIGDLTDEYLANILNFMYYEQGGFLFFVNKRVIKTLYKEAVRRGISVEFSKAELLRKLK